MTMTRWEVCFWVLISASLLMLAFYTGHSTAHRDLLEQCKGPEHGIRLHVGGKQYFYYCSYTPQ